MSSFCTQIAAVVVVLAYPGFLGAQVETAPQPDNRDKIFYPDDTENVVPLATKLVKNVLLDQKEIWTSPFRMHKKDAKWWIGFGAVTAALMATDSHTSHWLENSKGQVRWGNRVSDIGSTYTIIGADGAFYAVGALVDNAKARETGVLGAEALLNSLIVVEVFKAAVGRGRPNSPQEKGEFFTGGASFPSGHSIASWSLASVIAHEYSHTKWVPFVAYGLAGVVSGARFAAQQHYASDVVAGGAMGWFIGTYVYHTHENHALHHHGFLHPQIVPQLQPGAGTYAVSLLFPLGGE